MELITKQALEQGVIAHKEGKLQEAERLFRVVLQSQPSHPDANHNLGVVLVSVNKAQAALPLFKTALEANPKIEQFWLSYIGALIKVQQFENAKEVLEQGKKQGVAVEKLNVLETQLTSTTQTNEPKSALKGISPSDAQINSRLNLGVAFAQQGRLDEAEACYRQVIAMKPDYAEAHSNFGIVLKEQGRLEEAEASYRQAIELKTDFAEAHYNLGNTLKELDRSEEAEASYRQAIALKNDYAEAHYNLGKLLMGIGHHQEALNELMIGGGFISFDLSNGLNIL